MNERDRFEYTYSSSNRPKPLTGREQEIIADASDTGTGMKPVYAAILLGVVSCLVFGLGLTCLIRWGNFAAGIVLGLAGISGMAMAPSFYNSLSRKREQ